MKLLITIAFLLIQIISYCQHSEDWEEINQIQLINDNTIDSVHQNLKEYILNNPKSNYKSLALFYLAQNAIARNDIDSAIILYKQVLSTPFSDSIYPYDSRQEAAWKLADIYINKKQFNDGIHYLELAQNKYHPIPGCGNAIAELYFDMRLKYAICFNGLGNFNMAIDTLSPCMFANDLVKNSALVQKLYETYLKVHTKKEIRSEFINAIKKVRIKEPKFLFEITVFKRKAEITVLDFGRNELTDEEQIKKCVSKVQHSEIYKLAMGNK